MRDGQNTADYTESEAIAAALSQNWKVAIEINSSLLKENDQNIGVLNRLGFAYLKNGDYAKAKKMFAKVLDIDPYNQIALKNSKLLTTTKHASTSEEHVEVISPLMFLEEPGKTKVATCINVAPANTLALISPGREVLLKNRNHCIEVRTHDQQYLGALPDDLSFKLTKLIEAGNTYKTLIKSVGKNSLSVIIREISRGKRFANQPSFSISSSSYSSLSSSRAKISDKPDMSATGEEEEESPDIETTE